MKLVFVVCEFVAVWVLLLAVAVGGAPATEVLEKRAVLKDLSGGFCRAVWLACKCAPK